jgi:hypothetical protein
MNIDDPKLTAFALDELAEPERSTIARDVAESPEAQRCVDETRELARALKNEFAAEIANERQAPAPLRRNLSDIRDDPWFWLRARPLAVAAGTAIFAILSAVILATYNSRSSSTPTPGGYAVIEAEQNPPNDEAARPAAPDKIVNPWQSDAIRRIERVVIGEVGVDPHLENGELRMIELINDAYRIQRLKKRLSIPVVSKKSHRGLAGRSYVLMFVDAKGRIVASAQFYRVSHVGFVMQPIKNAYERGGQYFIGGASVLPGDWQSEIDYRDYVVEFPDWSECIGYAPSA